MNRHPRTVLSWVAYPILIGIVLISALVMMLNGLLPLAGTYVPVAITAFTVSLLEFFNPARIDGNQTEAAVTKRVSAPSRKNIFSLAKTQSPLRVKIRHCDVVSGVPQPLTWLCNDGRRLVCCVV